MLTGPFQGSFNSDSTVWELKHRMNGAAAAIPIELRRRSGVTPNKTSIEGYARGNASVSGLVQCRVTAHLATLIWDMMTKVTKARLEADVRTWLPQMPVSSRHLPNPPISPMDDDSSGDSTGDGGAVLTRTDFVRGLLNFLKLDRSRQTQGHNALKFRRILNAFFDANRSTLQEHFDQDWDRIQRSHQAFCEALSAVVAFRNTTGYSGSSEHFADYVNSLADDEGAGAALGTQVDLEEETTKIQGVLEHGLYSLVLVLDITKILVKLAGRNGFRGLVTRNMQSLLEELSSWAESD
ncbi:hypothetical protein BU23DRAFT_551904 [Bimuria novae-zelandiae CBS 107.79]|uniref:Uncharacterized protein n=1 Tax=Bimuria novae-zelandiae CBS 107.79 TaxID=1447943 RepID=A0A6A5VL40_9PLEO|nr:hypothetical protein BU23DRAFT_551904 [Bimuria novae-zelandiae CBS 107.79]